MKAGEARTAEPGDAGQGASVRARAIRRSLACFGLGWVALLPWLGVPFALAAWRYSALAHSDERRTWNPARPYRIFGVVLSVVGILLSLAAFVVCGIAYYSSLY